MLIERSRVGLVEGQLVCVWVRDGDSVWFCLQDGRPVGSIARYTSLGVVSIKSRYRLRSVVVDGNFATLDAAMAELESKLFSQAFARHALGQMMTLWGIG